MATSVAIHGTYSSVNTIKVSALSAAVSPVKMTAGPPKLPMTEMTTSLATRPLTSAVTACHSPKPSGTKTGATNMLTDCRKLYPPTSGT